MNRYLTPPPPYNLSLQNSTRPSSSTNENYPGSTSTTQEGNQYKEIQETLNILNQWIVYFQNIHNTITLKVDEYEKKQDDLNIILQKERLLEDSYRKLLCNQFFYGFFTPFLLILIFTGICYLYIKEDTIIFLKNYGWIVVLFTFSQILSFISPIWHIKQYNDRLNAIEKKLKLNGKE